jgi:hypothetical protein
MIDNRDMFKQMRRSPDPQQQAIGNFELSLWHDLYTRYRPILDKMLAASQTPEDREDVAKLIRELEEHSSP